MSVISQLLYVMKLMYRLNIHMIFTLG